MLKLKSAKRCLKLGKKELKAKERGKTKAKNDRTIAKSSKQQINAESS